MLNPKLVNKFDKSFLDVLVYHLGDLSNDISVSVVSHISSGAHRYPAVLAVSERNISAVKIILNHYGNTCGSITVRMKSAATSDYIDLVVKDNDIVS